MVDLKRRFFLFGAATSLVLPPVRTFFELVHTNLPPAPELLIDLDLASQFIPVPGWAGEMTLQMMIQLQRKLVEQAHAISGISRYMIINPQAYDTLIGSRSVAQAVGQATQRSGVEERYGR